MTTTANYQPHEYKPADNQAAEAIPFAFRDATDLIVTHIADADGAETVLTIGDDYAIGGDGATATGTITATADYPADDLFRVERFTNRAQLVDFDNQQRMQAEDVEGALDAQSLIDQEQDYRQGFVEDKVDTRALLVEEGQTAPAVDLTGLAVGDVFAFDGEKLVPAANSAAEAALAAETAVAARDEGALLLQQTLDAAFSNSGAFYLAMAKFPELYGDYLTANGMDGGCYDATDLSKIKQDSNGTGAAVEDQRTRYVEDLSGHGNHMNVYNSGGNDVMVRRDDDGAYQLEVVTGSYLRTANNKSLIPGGFLSAAIGYKDVNAFNIVALNNHLQQGIAIRDARNVPKNFGVLIAAFNDADGGTNDIPSPAAAYAKGLCGVMSVLVRPGFASTYLYGSSKVVGAIYDGMKRTVATTHTAGSTSISDAAFGLGTNGYGASTGEGFFKAGVWANDTIDGAMRALADAWCLWKSGQVTLRSLYYHAIPALGQSNRQGKGDASLSPFVPLLAGATYHNSGFIRAIRDPLQHLHEPPGAGSQGQQNHTALNGSLTPAYVNAYYARTGVPVYDIGCAASGRGLFSPANDFNWSRDGVLVDAAIARIKEALNHLVGLGGSYDMLHYTYMLGEQDFAGLASGAYTKQAYKDEIMFSVVDRMAEGLGIPALQCHIISSDHRGDNVDRDGSTLLDQEIYPELASEYPDQVKYVAPSQDFGINDAGNMTDPSHLGQGQLNVYGGTGGTNSAIAHGY